MKNHSNKQPQRSFRLLLNAACTLIVFWMLIPVAGAQTGVAPTEGNGSPGNPYQIATLENLIWLRDNTNSGSNVSIGKHFIQTTDIDMISISNWTPIGHGNMQWTTESSQPNAFRGVYDGQNFAIRNLRINSSLSQRGLFGYAWDATIRNVRIENADVIVGEASGILIGQSAHWQASSPGTPPVIIERVSVEGRLVSSGRRVGGIAGNPGMNTNITGQNVFIGEVTGTTDVGGLVGRASGSASVSFSYARAKVTGTSVGSSEGVGILVGNASTGAATFIEMYAEGEALATGGTQNRGAIGFAPQPGSGNHIVTDVWFDNSDGLALIGNSGAPNPSWVTINGGGGLTTAKMQGASASTNMTGTGDAGRWDFSSSGNWRTVTIPDEDYPVFEWQAGNVIEISGTVTVPSGTSQDGITVVAQVGDITFQDVTTTTDGSGNYSINAYNTPTQRVFARTTDNNGLPIGAAVEGPWEESATINLDLQSRSITISDGANNGWIRDGNEILAVEANAVLNVNTLRDRLLAGDVTVLAGVDITVAEDVSVQPNLTANTTLTLKAGGDIELKLNSNIASTGNPLNIVIWSRASGAPSGTVALRGAISTNGGHLWVGGGEQSATPWNGLTVGEGYVRSTSTSSAFILNGAEINTGEGNQRYASENANSGTSGFGMSINSTTIFSTTGEIEIRGNSDASNAIRFNAGTNNIGWNGVSGSERIITSGNVAFIGTKSSSSSGSAATIFTDDATSNVIASTGDISFSGNNGNGNNLMTFYGDDKIGWNGVDDADEFLASNVSINSTRGGAFLQGNSTSETLVVKLYTKSNGSFTFFNDDGPRGLTLANPNGFIRAGDIDINTHHDINFGNWQSHGDINFIAGGTVSGQQNSTSSSNKVKSLNGGAITIKTDEIILSSNNRIESSGLLQIKPTEPSKTIGLGGASETLTLPASHFTTNFEAGFSQITIGSPTQTGNITLNSISFRDNMRLQTSGTVVVNGNQTITLPNGVRLQVDNDLQLDSGAKININDN